MQPQGYKEVGVSKVDLFIAAFECDNYSSLSCYAKEGPGSILHDRGSSGKTANGVLKYLIAHRPKAYLGENVRGLAQASEGTQSDLEVLRQFLDAINYELQHFRVHAETYRAPTPRDRTTAV